MINRIRITVPKYIWSDPNRYAQWTWETYGRYLKPNGSGASAELDLQINLRWW